MLELYKNIKQRRIEIGMTQEELAKKVGYNGRSMIARVEKGEIDLPQSKIKLFASALGVSASDLMGDDIVESEELPIEFLKLNNEGKSRLLEYARLLQNDERYTK